MRRDLAIAIMATAVFGATPTLAQFDPWGGPAVNDPWADPAPIDPYQAPPPPVQEDPYQPATPGEGFETPQGQELAPLTQAPPVVAPPKPVRVANPVAAFSGLDKITGRLTSFEVAVDETVQFGALQVTPRACFSAPPEETPKTDTFVEIDEVTLDRDIRRIFTGWMFADSPGLNAVEHPVYDVWLRECLSEEGAAAAEEEAAAAN